MGARLEAAIQGAGAVLEQGGGLGGGSGQKVRVVLTRFELRRVDERDRLLEHTGVPSHVDVKARHIGKPKQIVRKVRAYPTPTRRVPPVLDVPLFELARGRDQNLLARKLRPRVDE